jgi:hypothetical protein
MGKPKLVWSPIHISLVNQYILYHIGRLEQVEVNIEGVNMEVDFEVIDIMDDSVPYPVLLGNDWAFDNNALLNLKKSLMSFEVNTLHLIVSLDPNGSEGYNEPMNEDQ